MKFIMKGVVFFFLLVLSSILIFALFPHGCSSDGTPKPKRQALAEKAAQEAREHDMRAADRDEIPSSGLSERMEEDANRAFQQVMNLPDNMIPTGTVMNLIKINRIEKDGGACTALVDVQQPLNYADIEEAGDSVFNNQCGSSQSLSLRFYLPGMNANDWAWATARYVDPASPSIDRNYLPILSPAVEADLPSDIHFFDVEIIGLTAENLAAIHTSYLTQGTRLEGVWRMRENGWILMITEKSGIYEEITLHPPRFDGSLQALSPTNSRHGRGFLIVGSGYGDRDTIDADGNLEQWDREGFVRTLYKMP
jgi:hypothetical protein